MKIVCSFILIFFVFSCKKEKTISISDCIKEKIEIFKTKVVCPNGALVQKYLFQGQEVYTFSDGNCIADGGAIVYNSLCTQIGFLGGIAGLRLVNGVVFIDHATLVGTIWNN